MSTLKLVPIEPDNAQHTAELLRQRELCGWGVESVPLWRKMMRDGDKCLYWILPTEASLYPLPDSEPLSMTPGIGPPPPDPTFQPLGHISLDREDYHDPPNKLLCSRDSPRMMVSTFFILKSLQGGGMGNKVMDMIEREARRLGADEITLNTWQGKDWTNAEFCRRIGVKFDPKARVNEYWYAKRGYVVFQEDVPRFPVKLPDGTIEIVGSVSMKKSLK